MTTNEIKSELNKVRESERAYRLAREKAEDYRQKLMGGKGVRYDSDGSTHQCSGNAVENAYCLLADYEAEADRLMENIPQARHYAETLMRHIADPVQREVLTRRYILDQRWEEISESMNYSIRHIERLHGWALKKISQKMS